MLFMTIKDYYYGQPNVLTISDMSEEYNLISALKYKTADKGKKKPLIK